MPDRQFNVGGVQAAPADWPLPDALALRLKTAYASFDGTNAGANFLPCLRILSDSGHVVAEAVASTQVVAGASADVSWFRRGGVGGASSTSGLTFIGARVYNSVNETFTTGTNSDFTYDTVATDTDGMADLGSNNKILTAQIAGFYLLTAQVTWEANATGRRIILIDVNGYYSAGTGQIVASATWQAIPAAGARTPTATYTVAYLNVGDFVSCGVYQASGGNLHSDPGPQADPYQNNLTATLMGIL